MSKSASIPFIVYEVKRILEKYGLEFFRNPLETHFESSLIGMEGFIKEDYSFSPFYDGKCYTLGSSKNIYTNSAEELAFFIDLQQDQNDKNLYFRYLPHIKKEKQLNNLTNNLKTKRQQARDIIYTLVSKSSIHEACVFNQDSIELRKDSTIIQLAKDVIRYDSLEELIAERDKFIRRAGEFYVREIVEDNIAMHLLPSGFLKGKDNCFYSNHLIEREFNNLCMSILNIKEGNEEAYLHVDVGNIFFNLISLAYNIPCWNSVCKLLEVKSQYYIPESRRVRIKVQQVLTNYKVQSIYMTFMIKLLNILANNPRKDHKPNFFYGGCIYINVENLKDTRLPVIAKEVEETSGTECTLTLVKLIRHACNIGMLYLEGDNTYTSNNFIGILKKDNFTLFY